MEPGYTPRRRLVGLPLHYSPSPEHTLSKHTRHGALGKVSDMSSTSRPLYSNFRTHFTLPRYSPALQIHFDTPEHASRLHHENPAGLSHLTHASAATQGAGRHTLSRFPQPCPSHQGTPELDASSSVWNRPSKHLYVSLVICGRHGSR